MSIVDRASTSLEEPFESLGTYQTFAVASGIAKGLAGDHQTAVFVQRVGEGWQVRVPSWVKLFLDQSAEERRWKVDESPIPEPDMELDDLRSELIDDAEDWNRSDQSGWFYPESDEGP
ncbi:hypothetical protein [Pseudoxanthomonas mexicana]